MGSRGLLGVLLFIFAAPAGAATLTRSIPPSLASGPFAVGDPVSGSFEIDSATPEQDPATGEGVGVATPRSAEIARGDQRSWN
jgi:hypothetical protein